jgi:hypothetical protein
MTRRHINRGILVLLVVVLLSCIAFYAYSMNEAASSITKLGYKTFSPRSTMTTTP